MPALPATLERRRARRDVFAAIREHDILLHHPYDSFAPGACASCSRRPRDPDVLAIKMTLYRVGAQLAGRRGAAGGRRATASRWPSSCELKARFDEESNIEWARALEREGVHVVYGLLGLEDALQDRAGGAPRGRRHPPLRAPRHRQLQRRHRPALHRPRPVHLRRGDRRRRHRPLQLPHRLLERRRATATLPRRPADHARAASRSSSAARSSTPRAGRGGHLIFKMNALVDQQHDPRCSTRPRRRACRSTCWCAASAACGPACPGVSENITRHQHRRPLPRAQPHLLLRQRRRADGATSAAPT